MKKIFKFFFLTNFLKGYFKAFLEKPVFSKKTLFRFYRKFGFNLEKLSNHYSQLKKQVKVDPETRSYDFLTKTREKNPMSGNIRILGMTLGFHLIVIEIKKRVLPSKMCKMLGIFAASTRRAFVVAAARSEGGVSRSDEPESEPLSAQQK